MAIDAGVLQDRLRNVLGRVPQPAHDAGAFVADVGRGAKDDRLTGLAAEVAFFGALSILPGLVATATAVTLLAKVGSDGVAGVTQQTIVGWVEGVVTDQGSAVVDAVRGLFERSNGDVFTFALLASLWSGSRGVDAVIQAVVQVANDVERRSWLKRRLLSLAMLVGTVLAAAVVVSMFVVGPLLGGAVGLAERFGAGDFFVASWRWVRLPVAGVALGGWALVMLHLSRPTPGRWRHDLPGALTTTLLWVAVSIGFRVYLATLGSVNPALGALGGALIVLFWFYLLAGSLLVGAEVAQQVRNRLEP